MISLDTLRKVGQFNKPHALQGEIGFTLTLADLFEEAEPDYLVCVIDGLAVPFFITEYRFKSDSSGLMYLEGINSDADARLLTNLDIYLPRFMIKQEEETNSLDQLIGYTLIDQMEGEVGTITGIDLSTLNTLLLVERGNEELYVPYAEEYFTEIDPESKTLYGLLPQGLISGDYVDEEK